MKAVGYERLGLHVALNFFAQPQFVYSLEFLLHEAVLEHDEVAGYECIDIEENIMIAHTEQHFQDVLYERRVG